MAVGITNLVYLYNRRASVYLCFCSIATIRTVNAANKSQRTQNRYSIDDMYWKCELNEYFNGNYEAQQRFLSHAFEL